MANSKLQQGHQATASHSADVAMLHACAIGVGHRLTAQQKRLGCSTNGSKTQPLQGTQPLFGAVSTPGRSQLMRTSTSVYLGPWHSSRSNGCDAFGSGKLLHTSALQVRTRTVRCKMIGISGRMWCSVHIQATPRCMSYQGLCAADVLPLSHKGRTRQATC